MVESISQAHQLAEQLDLLISEARNPQSMDIDILPTTEVLALLNREDHTVPDAVARVIPEIGEAVDRIVAAFRQGGRLIYLGAGTSGRLGVLDAVECPPTFGVEPTLVLGLMAGGPDAMFMATEGAEDDAAEGAQALQAIGLRAADVVVGIAVSGRTPYVIGGLRYARDVGATTVALACNPQAEIAEFADVAILPIVGPEVLTGSTRLKSGTAQKLILNMLSTASMIRLGKAYENLMVDLHPTNSKLIARAARIVTQATGCSLEEAGRLLERSGADVKLAILVQLTALDLETGRDALRRAGGSLRHAIRLTH